MSSLDSIKDSVRAQLEARGVWQRLRVRLHTQETAVVVT
jgi:hypothetical protein